MLSLLALSVVRNIHLSSTTTFAVPMQSMELLGLPPDDKRHASSSSVDKGNTTKAATRHWTMQEILRDRASKDGFVLLTAVNFGYREHLMNFKCNLDQFGMKHFVIAAMDHEMYEWGSQRGLPIYLASSANATTAGLMKQARIGGKFGSEGFRSLTKLKSVAVLDVLKAGYSVVWSDVDITWFNSPFEAFADFMKTGAGITIQSNAPFIQNPNRTALPHETVAKIEKTDNPAAYRRLNSGLYVAPNNALVRSAFQEIVDHAATTKLSEQPSFDEILCERAPSERSYASCTYRPKSLAQLVVSRGGTNASSLHVQLLDRFKYPNGAVLAGENNDNVYTLGREAFSKYTGENIVAAHNNWIAGESLKKQRQKVAGWWFVDASFQCIE